MLFGDNYSPIPFPQMPFIPGQEIKIMIFVVGGFDVPVRKELDPLRNPSERSTETARESTVNSFVEVKFQNERVRTVNSPGPNPAWNQELMLAFRPSTNDFSLDNLHSIRDNIYLHLFDEVR